MGDRYKILQKSHVLSWTVPFERSNLFWNGDIKRHAERALPFGNRP
jgi:hypothetical protein